MEDFDGQFVELRFDKVGNMQLIIVRGYGKDRMRNENKFYFFYGNIVDLFFFFKKKGIVFLKCYLNLFFIYIKGK